MENCLVIHQARAFCIMMRISTCVVSISCADCHIVIILLGLVEYCKYGSIKFIKRYLKQPGTTRRERLGCRVTISSITND